jgi:hypothetical protein
VFAAPGSISFEQSLTGSRSTRAFRGRRGSAIMTVRDELRAARQAYAKKFDELCLAIQWGEDPDPSKLSDKRRAEIADEAEELVKNFDMASVEDNLDLKPPKTELQRLLAEHHEIGQRILDLQHKKCVEDGLILDDSDDSE